jgi:predicted nucleic acid-binding protein
MIDAGFLVFASLTDEDAKRACYLMRKYADCPMDFADASLVLAAERLGATKVLTLDSHFYAYRINESTPFEVLP